jgi:hypothetical protein
LLKVIKYALLDVVHCRVAVSTFDTPAQERGYDCSNDRWDQEIAGDGQEEAEGTESFVIRPIMAEQNVDSILPRSPNADDRQKYSDQYCSAAKP